MFWIYLVGRRQGANWYPRLLLVYTAMSSSSPHEQGWRGPQPSAPVVSGSSIVSDQSLKLLHLSTRSCCRPPRTRRWPHPQCAITDGSDAVRIMFPQSNDRIFSSSRGTWTAVERGIGDENRAPPPLVQNAFRWAGGTRARRQRSTSSGSLQSPHPHGAPRQRRRLRQTLAKHRSPSQPCTDMYYE